MNSGSLYFMIYFFAMTTITILPEEKNYRAVAGKKESVGRTIGAALDALTAQLDEEESGTLVVIQNQRPDKFFTLAQQKRLAELNGAKQRAEELFGGLKP